MVKARLWVAAIVATVSFSASAASEQSLEQRIQYLEQQLQTKAQLQNQMSMQVIELQKEVKELRGIIEENDYKLQQIQDRQRDIYRDLENRLSAAPQQQSTATQVTPKQSTTTGTTGNNQVISQDAANQVKQAVVSGNEQAEFEAAFKLVRDRQYSQAIQAFEAFLVNHPQGNYSDNARYWIGQVYYAQSNFDEAEKQFAMMRSQFPDSSKLPSALIKLAEIKVRQEKWEEAKTLYTEIEQNYTGSVQQLARKGLQDIKAKGH